MLNLPKSTYVGKIIAKDKIYSHSGANSALKDLFVKQVERIRWLHKISPLTVNIARGEQVDEIQVIEVVSTVPNPDKLIFQAIRKAIPYKIVFELVCADKTSYTVGYDSKTSFPSDKPPKLIGGDTDSVWENIITQIGGISVAKDRTLDEQIAADAERQSLIQKIERLEKRALSEKQPRKKWELAEEIKAMKKELMRYE